MSTYRNVRRRIAEQHSKEKAADGLDRLKALREKLAHEQRDRERGRLEREEPRRG